MKQLVQGVFATAAGIAGNLIAAYIQADIWSNVFTPVRVLGTLVALALALLVLALLESRVSFYWSRRWHVHRYRRELLSDPRIRRWSDHYGRLDFLQKSRPLLRADVVRQGSGTVLPLTQVLREDVLAKEAHARRVLVVGEPGSGKTTGLERLTWELASSQYHHVFGTACVPILVRLNTLHATTVEAFIKHTLESSTKSRSGKILASYLHELAANGQVVLLFDALDEALAGAQGEDIKRQIADLVTNNAFQRVPIAVTSRTREEPGFIETVYVIQDLSDKTVREFIVLYRPHEDIEEIWNQLTSNHLLESRALGRNPFWLQYFLQAGSFTGSREELIDHVVTKVLQDSLEKESSEIRSTFDSGVDRVVDREFTKSRPWKLPSNLTVDEGRHSSRRALAWLAYRMSVRGVTSVQEDEAKKEFQLWLQTLAVPLGWTPDDLLHLGQDAQLLNYPYDQSTGFRHRLFQEILTAWGLTFEDSIKENWTREIEAHADEVAWWQTLIFLVEMGAKLESLLEPVLQQPTAQRLTLAAVLAEHTPEGKTGSAADKDFARSRFYASVQSGISEGHRVAIDALQRLAGNAVIAVMQDMLTKDAHLSGVFDAGLVLLEVLDTKMIQALSSVIASEQFAEHISATHVQSLTTILSMVELPTAAALLSRVTADISTPIITQMKANVQDMLLGNHMQPAAVGYVLIAMGSSAARASLSRVSTQRRVQILAATATTAAPLLVRDLETTEAATAVGALKVATGAHLLQHVPPGAAGQIVAAMPVEVAAPLLATMLPWAPGEVQAAVRILEELPHRVAGEILAAMLHLREGQVQAETMRRAPRRLISAMSPEAVRQILEQSRDDIAGDILAALPRQEAVQLLASLSREVAEQVVATMPRKVTEELLAAVSPDVVLLREKLAQLPLEAAGQVLKETPRGVTARLLTVMPREEARQLIATMPREVVAELLVALPEEVMEELSAARPIWEAEVPLDQMPRAVAGQVLAAMPRWQAGQLLLQIPRAVAGQILAAMPCEIAGQILSTTQSAGTLLLAAMPPETRADVAAQMSSIAILNAKQVL